MSEAHAASINVGGAGSQQGDTSIGSVAARDLYQGLGGDQLARLLEQQSEFYLTLVSSYEKAVTDATRKIDRLRDEQDIANRGALAAREADRKARETLQQAEREEREARQRALDARLRRIEVAIGALALTLCILAWRLWPAITAAATLIARTHHS